MFGQAIPTNTFLLISFWVDGKNAAVCSSFSLDQYKNLVAAKEFLLSIKHKIKAQYKYGKQENLKLSIFGTISQTLINVRGKILAENVDTQIFLAIFLTKYCLTVANNQWKKTTNTFVCKTLSEKDMEIASYLLTL